jgi:hypothetical protein
MAMRSAKGFAVAKGAGKFPLSTPPKENINKIATPGSRGGAANQTYNAGQQAGGTRGPSSPARMSPARSARSSNAPKARGKASMVQGGSSQDKVSGLSKTNKGRQRL